MTHELADWETHELETSGEPNTTSCTQPDTSKESIENPTVNFLGKKCFQYMQQAGKQVSNCGGAFFGGRESCKVRQFMLSP